MVMPESWPYFSAGITESGPIAPWNARPQFVYDAVYKSLLEQTNCTSIDCLRQLNATELMKLNSDTAERNVTDIVAYNFLSWAPVIDGKDLVEHPLKLMKAGKIHKVPMLVGTNLNEGTEFVRGMGHDGNASDLSAWILKNFGPVYAPKVAAMYPISSYKSPWWVAVQIITDSFMTCPSRAFIRAVTKNQPGFLYQVGRKNKCRRNISHFSPQSND